MESQDDSDEFLLRTLQERGVILKPCSFVSGGVDKLGQICQKYGIFKAGEFPPAHYRERILTHPICYCPEHRDLLKSGDHHGWCNQYVIIPNADVARCQHTGAFSWLHKQYLCKEHLTPTDEYPRAT